MTVPPRKNTLRPYTSARRPASTRSAEYARLKPTSVHWSSPIEALNSLWMTGTATATAEVGIDVTPLEMAIAVSTVHLPSPLAARSAEAREPERVRQVQHGAGAYSA